MGTRKSAKNGTRAPRAKTAQLKIRAQEMYRTGRYTMAEVAAALATSRTNVGKWCHGLQDEISLGEMTAEEKSRLKAERMKKIASEERCEIENPIEEITVQRANDYYKKLRQAMVDERPPEGWTPESCMQVLVNSAMDLVQLSHRVHVVGGNLDPLSVDSKQMKLHTEILREAKAIIFANPNTDGELLLESVLKRTGRDIDEERDEEDAKPALAFPV